jgi:LemA protein
MKKGTIILIVVLAFVAVSILLVLVGAGYFVGKANEMVRKQETVKTAWSQVENVYQRRFDLIPNLVEVVKGYAKHERETFEAVTNARAKMGGMVNIPQEAINNPELMRKYAEAQTGLGSALQRLMVVSEQYPELKANENFKDLQAQLEGTENRITVERRRYNEVVQEYNIYIRIFPNSIVAGIRGFKPAELFKMDEAAAKAPQVKF